ncbi:MAG: histidine phosphatase family protein [Phycisphaerales bacterium]
MFQKLPFTYLARHGETAWSLTGQHTGLTDLPLTKQGEQNARNLGERLKGINFAHVLTSNLQRAVNTCRLAGFEKAALIDKELVEWNYGEYEGLRTSEIRQKRPGWEIFQDGCPGGETIPQIMSRADRVIARIRAFNDNVLIFSSGHFIKILALRWLGLDSTPTCKFFMLSTASLSILGYKGDLGHPVIWLWNDDHHVMK